MWLPAPVLDGKTSLPGFDNVALRDQWCSPAVTEPQGQLLLHSPLNASAYLSSTRLFIDVPLPILS